MRCSNTSEQRLRKSMPKMQSLNPEASILPRRMSAALKRCRSSCCKGKVKGIVTFGAFVEILPGKEGLVHISELAPQRVEKVEDVLSMGDELEVKCIGVDPQGKIKLSRKALLQAV